MIRKQTSLYHFFRNNLIWMPIVLGLILFSLEVGFEWVNMQSRIEREAEAYRVHIQARMKEQVENAVGFAQKLSELDDTQAAKTEAIVAALEGVHTSEVGYIFAGDYQGNTMIGPAKGVNTYEIVDKTGLKVVQALIAKAQVGGGYVTYIMPPVGGALQVEKISYVLPFEPLGWYVGAGVSMDALAHIETEIHGAVMMTVFYKFWLIAVGIALSVLVVARLNRQTYNQIKKQVDVINEFLNVAAKEHAVIDMGAFSANEFRAMAIQTQKMVDTRTLQESKLMNQAFFDTSTGFYNRNGFNRELEKLLSGVDAGASDVQGAVVFIDIDHFKITNDMFGHTYGDKVIQSVGDRLNRTFKKSVVSRFGGDEFTMILYPVDGDLALEKLLSEIKLLFNEGFEVDERVLNLSVSMGVVTFPLEGHVAEDLLRKADMAMYTAKSRGRNCHVYYDESMLEGMSTFFNLESDLKQAVQRDEFVLYYQPIYSTKNYEITGFEALIRWFSPVHGLVMPGQFIPIAEQTNLITHITELVIEKAFVFSRKMLDMGYLKQSVSFNMPVQGLLVPNFSKLMLERVQRMGISPTGIIIEITETGLIENFEATVQVLSELRSMGFVVALDDFGTGYSSLNYIVELPIDVIKIDKKFIDHIVTNEKSLKMVEVIVDISSSLVLKCVAEGVETELQAQTLASMGVNLLQGYHFSKPIPEADALILLSKH